MTTPDPSTVSPPSLADLDERIFSAIEEMDLTAATLLTTESEYAPSVQDVISGFKACLSEQGLRIYDTDAQMRASIEHERLNAERDRLRAAIGEALDGLAGEAHVKTIDQRQRVMCDECGGVWPCPTADVEDLLRRALDPEAET